MLCSIDHLMILREQGSIIELHLWLDYRRAHYGDDLLQNLLPSTGRPPDEHQLLVQAENSHNCFKMSRSRCVRALLFVTEMSQLIAHGRSRRSAASDHSNLPSMQQVILAMPRFLAMNEAECPSIIIWTALKCVLTQQRSQRTTECEQCWMIRNIDCP
jgi:hypothetical protein